MKNLIKARKAAIAALKELRKFAITTSEKNATDDLIAQTELVSDALINSPKAKFWMTMKGDDQKAFAMAEEEAGL